MLNDYKKTKQKNATGKSPSPDDNGKDFMDDAAKETDKMTLNQIAAILKEHEKEMNRYVPLEGFRKSRDDLDSRQTGPKQSLDDVDMEENKRDIIHREIGKFREIMKIREAEKEEEKKKREKEVVGPEPAPRSRESRESSRREASKVKTISFKFEILQEWKVSHRVISISRNL